MKKAINFYDFEWGFNELRPESFSYDGLKALFDYLEELEEDTGEEIEFDVISLCCDYSEYETAREAVKDYTGDELEEQDALKYLEDKTTVIAFNGGVIIQAY